MKPLLLLAAATLAAGAGFAASAQSAPAQPDGEALYRQWCAGCHDPVSELVPTMPATTLLEQRYQGRIPGALVERGDLTVPVIELFVRRGAGFMPFFRKAELSDAELRALAEYVVAQGQRAQR